jgi:hypothetical protein
MGGSWVNLLFFGVVFIGVIAFVYVYKKGGHSLNKDAVSVKIFKDWGGWIELSSLDYKPLLYAKMLRQHQDSIWFGYGCLIKENMNSKLLEDLNSMGILNERAGNILVKVGVDALSSNVISELLEDSSERLNLQRIIKVIDENKVARIWMTSHDVVLPKESDQISQFDEMWENSVQIQT